MATVTDDPLSKKVEMTNWEKVWPPRLFRLHYLGFCAIKYITDNLSRATTSIISMH